MLRFLVRLFACLALITTSALHAQGFPNKPIRLICSFPPGGAVDIASRAIAIELAKSMGQPIAVDNKPGAGGNIGGAEAARTAPDGYTLFMTTSAINGINPALYDKMPFDPNQDLVAVSALVSLNNVPSSIPHIKAGKLKALVTTGAKRDPALPDLPTITEAGVPGDESGVWFGLMVPAGTPKAIIAKLNAETVKATQSPEFIKRMSNLGYIVIGSSSDEMTAMLKTEVSRWGPIVKASGANAD